MSEIRKDVSETGTHVNINVTLKMRDIPAPA